MARLAQCISLLVAAGLGCAAQAETRGPGAYIYAWAGDEDEKDSDFLAVIDADPGSATYGAVVATAPIGAKGVMPHHTEYETPAATTLFANGWKAGRTFVLDIAEPLKPRVTSSFRSAGIFSHAHSFARLPSGNVLATFQSIGQAYAPPGGLVELDQRGRFVRGSRSATPDIPTAINWPYSLAVAPGIDRVVTTSTDMGLGPNWKSPETRHVQLWSLSDLRLLSSIALPDSGKGHHHAYPAEPRLLADGSVYVNTFTCGLYRIDGLALARPSARFVHAFPSGPELHDMCAVPLVYGKYWIQTVGAINGLVVLDASDPDRPVEVSRLTLPPAYHVPHWLAADRAGGRIAVTGMEDSWLVMLKFDERTGRLSVDESFGSDRGRQPGFQFNRAAWPHGRSGKAIVHGVLFSK